MPLTPATEREEALLEALIEMVAQHCADGEDRLDSWALSTNAEAMRVLQSYGKIKITQEYGRRVIGHWVGNGNRT